MLFAELHGKLDPNSPDLERREDVLTSTTFGTLLVAGATDVLGEWLNLAGHFGREGGIDREQLLGMVVAPPVKYWFWPSLAGGTQPDVVLRIGQRLLVVEAKYGSHKGRAGINSEPDGDSDDDTSTSDQLLREWQAIQPEVPSLAWYPSDLREAIEQCDRQLVYLVSARHTPSAITELRESQEKIRASGTSTDPLWLLTWQDLHSVLVRRSLSGRPTAPWIPELARVLDRRRHVAAFLGFPHVLEEIACRPDTVSSWANEWSGERFAEVFAALGGLDLNQLHRTASLVEQWAGQRENRGHGTYFDQWDRIDIPNLERLVDYTERQNIYRVLGAYDE